MKDPARHSLAKTTASSSAIFTSDVVVSSGEILANAVVGKADAVVIASILSGGVMQDASFVTSAQEIVYSGGLDSGSKFASGTKQYVFSGGVALDDTYSGTGIVFGGGLLESGIVSSGGALSALSGGVIVDAEILSGGSVSVFDGGIASGALVESGGEIIVASGAYAGQVGGHLVGGVISSGGAVLDGGLVTGTVVDGVLIASGGLASGVTLQSGGVIVLLDGGRASDITNDGGAVVSTGIVGIAGTAFYTSAPLVSNTVYGSTVIVLQSGVDSGAIVGEYGELRVESGGLVVGTHIEYYGSMTVSSGAEASGTVIDYLETVLSGGLEVGARDQDGTLVVSQGGMVSSATIVYGRLDLVGGTATDTMVSGQVSDENGTEIRTTLAYGAEEVVVGGTIIDTVIQAGAVQALQDGTTASGTHIEAQGYQYVSASTVESSFVDGGVQELFGGAQARDTVVTKGGRVDVYSGAVLSGGSLTDGVALVRDGGTVSGVVLSSGSYIALEGSGSVVGIVSSGGSVVSTGVLSGNGASIAYAPLYADATLSGGWIEILDSGALSNCVLTANQEVTILSGGRIEAATVSHDVVTVSSGGEIEGGFVGSGATIDLLSGGVASGIVFSGTTLGGMTLLGGNEYGNTYAGAYTSDTVSAGIATSNTLVNSGVMFLLSGGEAISTIVSSGGDIDNNDAIASGSIVLSGGQSYAEGGGTNIAEIISSGGGEYVLQTASAVSAQLDGGVQFVYYGASASGTVIHSGGVQLVAQNGFAVASEVMSGGVLIALPGADVSGVINAGGAVVSTGVVLASPREELAAAYGSATSGLMVSGRTEFVLQGGTATGSFVQSAFDPREGNVQGEVDVAAGGRTIGDQIGAGGLEYVSSGGSASATQVASGGVLDVYLGGVALGASILSGGEIGFQDPGNGSVLSDVTDLSLAVGAIIDCAAVRYTAGTTAKLDESTNILSIDTAQDHIKIQLSGDYTGDYFAVGLSSTYAVTVRVEQATPCYCPGTLIRTPTGDRPIETLSIGDEILTLDGSVKPLRWIGRRSYDGRFIAGRRDVLPIRFLADSLGDGLPSRDLTVSPLHAIHIGGLLVPAAALVNGVSIVQLAAVDTVSYLHLEFDDHVVVWANDVPAESFVDDDSRALFHNAAEYDALYPARPVRAARLCAPRVEEGEQVALLHDMLRRRAQAAAGPRVSAGRR